MRAASSVQISSPRGTSLVRKIPLHGPYTRSIIPRVLGWSKGGWLFLMCEVPPYWSRRVLALCQNFLVPPIWCEQAFIRSQVDEFAPHTQHVH